MSDLRFDDVARSTASAHKEKSQDLHVSHACFRDGFNAGAIYRDRVVQELVELLEKIYLGVNVATCKPRHLKTLGVEDIIKKYKK